MNLTAVETDIERLTKTANNVKDSAALVQELSQEVRTISHLLHPPLLDEAGLASALRWYIEGFAQRSEIQADLERLARESETAIFRTVQECLTNIHRHSESPTARIRIAATDGHVRVEATVLRRTPRHSAEKRIGTFDRRYRAPAVALSQVRRTDGCRRTI